MFKKMLDMPFFYSPWIRLPGLLLRTFCSSVSLTSSALSPRNSASFIARMICFIFFSGSCCLINSTQSRHDFSGSSYTISSTE